MAIDMLPTCDEISKWMLETLRHSMGVEYYLYTLDLGHRDPQRPHDVVGKGNKFSWPVIKGLAIQLRDNSSEFFDTFVLPSIQYHRRHQYHHRMWNNQHKKATHDDMKVGAIDSLCSLLEESEFRKYQGGHRTFEEVIEVIKSNQPWKVKWFWMVYSQMKIISRPRYEDIKSLNDFSNIGISEEIFERYAQRIEEAKEELKKSHGYEIKKD